MALPHDHQHDHDNQPPPWHDDDEPCCPDEPGVRIRAITFDELEDYLEQLANPTQRPPVVGTGRHQLEQLIVAESVEQGYCAQVFNAHQIVAR
mgnify:CR=1 FL=1